MFGCVPVTSNTNGIPYLWTLGVTVGTESIDFGLGLRRIPPVVEMNVRIADAIPEGADATLPVRLVLNGNARTLTYFGGQAVTAADLVGVGVIKVIFDRFSGTLQLLSVIAAPAAAAATNNP